MKYFEELAATLAQVDATPLLPFARACTGTLYIAGNGGSMATAQHWACDLLKAAGVRAQALGSNPAILTAFANDNGYRHALRSELERNKRPGDALICLSCSGTSKNITELLLSALFYGLPAAIVTGPTWENPTDTPIPVVNVPHQHYGVIEDCFMAIGHWLTEELRG